MLIEYGMLFGGLSKVLVVMMIVDGDVLGWLIYEEVWFVEFVK